MDGKDLAPLSASRIKNLTSCHWSYWARYHLMIPQSNNSGALRGSICHMVFEFLLKKKHKKHYDAIIESDNIQGSEAVDRYVKSSIARDGRIYEFMLDPEHYELISEMILVGLKDDFFCKGSKLLDPEYSFNIYNEEPQYLIRGFIDKAAEYKRKKEILIKDYKSSKSKFEGEDLESNVQAMMYSLVARKVWPKLKPVVQFLFLKFPEDPIQELRYQDEQLDGFELYLNELSKLINNFTEEDAKSNFAADQKFPAKGEGFKGPLNCGFAKYKGQLKKDGSIMWHCPYKFDLDYYAIVDEEDNVVTTAINEKELPELKDGQKITIKHYDGCPKFQTKKEENDPFDF